MQKRKTGRLLCLLLTVLLLAGALPLAGALGAETVTSLGFAERGLTAYREGWVYTYGGKGGDSNGDGIRESDCAGLLYSYFIDHGITSCAGGASSQVRLNTIWHGGLEELPRIHGLSITMPDAYDYEYPYSHVGIYVGNSMVADNSTYGVNMVYGSVFERGWTEWHLFDCGLQYPVNGWYEFDGAMYHYTDYQYDVNTTVDGYAIGEDGVALGSDGEPLENDGTLGNSGFASASAVRDYLESAGIGYAVGAGYSGESSGSRTNAQVTGNGVRVRAQATTQSAVLTTLYQGAKLQVTGQVTGESVASGGQTSALWYEIVVPGTGATGYISSLFVEITGDLDVPDTPVITCQDGYVSMTASSEEETIYYTTDGSAPTQESTPYIGPVYLVEGTTFKAISVLDGQSSPVAVATVMSNGSVFRDFTAQDWYFDDIDRAMRYGIFQGQGDGIFNPGKDITRADFVRALANLDGVDLGAYTGDTVFQDVSPSSYYAPAVQWASSQGYINGVDATTFQPNAPIKREEMCVILAKYSGLTANAGSNAFADDGKISSWAKDAVYACRDNGIISGVGDNQFAPRSSATRAQACVVLSNYYELYR